MMGNGTIGHDEGSSDVELKGKFMITRSDQKHAGKFICCRDCMYNL